MSPQEDIEWTASQAPMWVLAIMAMTAVGLLAVDIAAGLLRVARRMIPTQRMALAAVVRVGIGTSLLVLAGMIASPLTVTIIEFAGKAMLFLAAYGLIGHAEGVFQAAVARLLGIDE